MSVILGTDCGGKGTKMVVFDTETRKNFVERTFESLRDEPLINWIPKLQQWTEEMKYPLSEIDGVGIAIAAPLVHGRIHEKAGKFSLLRGNTVENIAHQLSQECGGIRVAILHDAAAALLGELAIIRDNKIARSSGILTFGASIGFGYAFCGEILTAPYTSWVSHIQLRPGFPTPPCGACHQRGCWREVYQKFRDQEDNQALVEVIAQGTATVLNTLPLDCLFLGGGRISSGGDELFDQICRELKPRLVIDPKKVVHPASAGQYAGAIGAAFYAYRNPKFARQKGT